jgi:nitrogen-specific signal transduction histidine kinase
VIGALTQQKIAQQIVLAHHRRIDVDSSNTTHTVFTVIVPRRP